MLHDYSQVEKSHWERKRTEKSCITGYGIILGKTLERLQTFYGTNIIFNEWPV